MAIGQHGQGAANVVAAQALAGQLERRLGPVVLDEVSELDAIVVADRLLQRDGLLRHAQDVAHLARAPAQLAGDLGGRGLAAQRRQEPAFGVRDLVELLDDVNRDANRAALLGDRAGDGLADPPGRVGRQLVAAAVVELLHRADQAERALLDEVEEGCPASEVALRDEDHEAQIGLDHLLLGRVVAALDAPGQRALLCAGQQRHLADRAQVQAQGVRRRLGGQVDRRLALVERSYRVLWHVVAFRMRGSSDLQPGGPADGLNRVVAPLVDATCRDREGASRTMSGDSGPVQPTLLRWEHRGRARRKIDVDAGVESQRHRLPFYGVRAVVLIARDSPRERQHAAEAWVADRAERRARSGK